MKRATLTLSILCALNAFVFAGPEPYSGKEMKQVAPTPSCDYNWTGFYIGANLGYGCADTDTSFEPLPDVVTFFGLNPTTIHPDSEGVIAGGQVGYNHQWGKFVLGVEADFQWSDIGGTDIVSPILDSTGAPDIPSFLRARESTDWFGTFRLRAGFTPFCRLLVYGTGGLAFGDVNYAALAQYNVVFFQSSFDRIKVGWTVGGGLEYALTKRWSVKAEYLYYELGDESAIDQRVPPRPPFNIRSEWDTTASIARAGLNFKF